MRADLNRVWAGQWLARKLAEHDSVSSIQRVDAQVLRIERVVAPLVTLFVTSVQALGSEDVEAINDQHSDVDGIVNIKRDGHVTGAAIAVAEAMGIGLLGVGDTMRALRDKDNIAKYMSPEVMFVSRGLLQHSRVDAIERLDEARYLVRRSALGDVVILVALDYELTASRVRELIAFFVSFDAIAASNPNGTVTEEALAVAEGTNIVIFRWAQLLSALHEQWT